MEHHNSGHRSRMRQRMLSEGLSGFMDHEILEVLLYQSIPRKNTNHIAHALLDKFGSIYNVLNASPQQLMTVDGISEVTACNLSILKEVWQRYKRSEAQRIKLSGIKSLIQFAKALIGDNYVEQFIIIYVDNATNHLYHEVFTSNNTNSVQIDVKKIVASAVRVNASGAIICHCHPNGECTPSEQDVKFTRSLFYGLASLNVMVLDHVIFNGTEHYFSFHENCLMKKIQADYCKNLL